MTEERPSLLDFASKEAFGCDDYEPRGEVVEEHVVTPEDGIYTVLAKSKKLTDRILDGKSIAVAFGDIKIKRREELEQKKLTLKERHKWQLWKNAKGEMPPMLWHAQQEEQEQQWVDEQVGNQQSLGKRKSSIFEGDQHRRVKKRNDDEKLKVSTMEMDALAEIYHLPSEMKGIVTESDVRYFRRTYAPLKPLLSAVTKMMRARSEASHAVLDSKTEEEYRLVEMHSTQKAIYLAEKQAKWILEETVKMCDSVQEQVSIMRGRLSALGDQHDDTAEEEEEDEYEAASSTPGSPISNDENTLQGQVDQNETARVEAIHTRLESEQEGDYGPVGSTSPKQAEMEHVTHDHDRLSKEVNSAFDRNEPGQQAAVEEDNIMSDQAGAEGYAPEATHYQEQHFDDEEAEQQHDDSTVHQTVSESVAEEDTNSGEHQSIPTSVQDYHNPNWNDQRYGEDERFSDSNSAQKDQDEAQEDGRSLEEHHEEATEETEYEEEFTPEADSAANQSGIQDEEQHCVPQTEQPIQSTTSTWIHSQTSSKMPPPAHWPKSYETNRGSKSTETSNYRPSPLFPAQLPQKSKMPPTPSPSIQEETTFRTSAPRSFFDIID